MLDSIISKYSIVRGALRSDEIGYIAFVRDDLVPNKVEHTFLLVFHKGKWLWPTNEDRVNWTTTSLAVVEHPKEQALFMGLFGQIFRVGSGDVAPEGALTSLPDGPESFGPMRCIRAINGRAYAVGMGRQAYVRLGLDRWERIDFNVRTGLSENNIFSFETVHGFSEHQIFAAGRRGEIWFYDGASWTQEDSPTNRIITDLWCSGTGLVIACGMAGTILVRDADGWRVIDHGATDEDFWSIAELGERIFLATMRNVYELRKDSLIPVDFGDDAPATCFMLTAASGVLWSVGAKNIFSFDGQTWSRIV
jgi:hypothetical protein